MKKQYLAFLAAAAVLAVALTAQADTIWYTVAGWGPSQFAASTTPPANAPWGPNGYPGDTVQLQTFTGTLDLTPGIYTQKINTLLWTIDYTYGGTATDPNAWSDLTFIINAIRNISFSDGISNGNISQTGLLEATWFNDYLTFNEGPTVTFLVQGFEIAVTPLGLDRAEGSNFEGPNPWVQPSRDVMARFVVTAVPDAGSTLALLGVAIASLAVFRPRLSR